LWLPQVRVVGVLLIVGGLVLLWCIVPSGARAGGEKRHTFAASDIPRDDAYEAYRREIDARSLRSPEYDADRF